MVILLKASHIQFLDCELSLETLTGISWPFLGHEVFSKHTPIARLGFKITRKEGRGRHLKARKLDVMV